MRKLIKILCTAFVVSTIATLCSASLSCSTGTKDKTSSRSDEPETRILAQLNYEDAIRQLSELPYDQYLNQALFNTTGRMARIENDSAINYVEIFINEYRNLKPDADFSTVFDFIDKGDNDATVVEKIRKQVLDKVLPQTIGILKKRMDNAGVRADIKPVDNNGPQIDIKLFNPLDSTRLKRLLEKKGDLEFFTVYTLGSLNSAFINGQINVRDNDSDMIALAEMLANNPMRNHEYCILGYASTTEQMEAIDRAITRPEIKAILPDNFELRWSNFTDNNYENFNAGYAAYALRKDPNSSIPSGAVLNGAVISDANAHGNTYGGYEISIIMNDEGAKLWANITKDNLLLPIAMLIDGKVYFAPKINMEITGGRSSITGNFSQEEATDIANILKAGKCNTPLEIIQIR